MKEEPTQFQFPNPFSRWIAELRDLQDALQMAESSVEFELAMLHLQAITKAMEYLEINWEP